jgi:16S rRNA processing protein RimM
VSKQSEAEWATIGKVVALFGVHGELKVLSLTDIPNRFAELDAVYLGPDHNRYAIQSARPYKGEMVVLKLAGIEDANTAETLRNFGITIPLSQLAKLPPDSYYQHDILGLHVSTLDGRDVGKIVDIMITGSNDVYIIKAADGRQVLVPAIKEVVKQVDLIRKMMYIEPIKGLLDDTEAVSIEEEEEESE